VSKRRQKAARAASPAARPGTSGAVRPVLIGAALVLLNVIVFGAVRRFEFVNWDDPTYILENANVLKGLSWETARWALTTASSPYWHPLTWLSHLLDVSMFGLDAGAHHLTNLLLHIANTLLVFGLLRRMTGAEGKSAFVAAVFAVHPLHVESVAWVAERKDVLSTFFWALTIWTYLSYVSRRSVARYTAVMALFLLALMSKPMVVTLPAVLLLLDVWPLRRSGSRSLVVEKIPLFAMSAIASIATVLVQNRVGAMATLDALPWHVRVSNAIAGYVGYLWTTLWPARLAAFYPLKLAPAWFVVSAAILLIAATMAAWRVRERHPYVIVGWGWFVITIAPVIGFLQAGEQARADRFMYVPMIGLLLIVAWGVPEVAARWLGAANLRKSLGAVAIVVVLVCSVTAHAQVQTWRSSVTLWRHAVEATPDSYIAYENLAQALRDRGQLDEALTLYARALPLAPGGSSNYEAVIQNSMGLVLTRKGSTDEAVGHFARAVRLNPRFVEAKINLANALASAGRFDEAIPHYRATLDLEAELTEARVGLGGALLSQGKPADAAREFLEALRLDGDLPEAHNGLGAALSAQGQNERAMQQFNEALRLKPDLASAHFNIAVLLIRQGRIAEGRRELQAALAIDSSYLPARQLLARIEGLEDP
jgi:protein O-mannosyl-transferase